jgi:hypothetical protein
VTLGEPQLFNTLRALMRGAAPQATTLRDDTGHFELAGPATDKKTGQPLWFGMVKSGARAVSYHLMPIYTHPHLAQTLSPTLEKRRQGKSCFKFTKADPEVLAELAELTRHCAMEVQ